MTDVAKRLVTDFPWFAETFVKVEDKDGNTVPLKLNHAQRKLWAVMQEQQANGQPVRIMVLKARQLGISTFMQAFLLWKAITTPGSRCIVVSHDEDAATDLSKKGKFAYEQLPTEWYKELLALKATDTKGKELAWKKPLSSTLIVDTARNTNAGRGSTFQHAHLSEGAFWEPAPEKTMKSLGAAIRRAQTVVKESTANGMGNLFHDDWKAAESGRSSYYPLFIGWNEDPSYSRPWRDDDRGLKPSERKLMADYGLTRDQIAWRRDTIADDFAGDEIEFAVEYPISAAEAFLVTGQTYLKKPILMAYREMAEEGDRLMRSEGREGAFRKDATGAPVFEDFEGGPWRIFRKPQPGRRYIIDADPSGGTSLDSSSIDVLDAESLEQVASYLGKVDPDELAYEIWWMACAYNFGLMAVERNGEGRATVLKLQRIMADMPEGQRRPRLFYHVAEDSMNTKGEVGTKWGWRTSTTTRPVMLSQFAELARELALKVRDSRTVDQMETLVRSNAQRIAEAAPGAHDDAVMSIAIGCTSEVRAQAMTGVDDAEDDYVYEASDSVTAY